MPEILTKLTCDETQLVAAMTRGASMAEKFEKKMQQVGRTSGVGLPGIDLNPQSLRVLDQAAAKTAELTRQTFRAGTGGMYGSMGFLAFSQAVEDAQYGVRGILNNIPQMVLGFGGGLGLAGAISLAAVAATTLYPHLKKLYGTADNENLKAAGEAWVKIFNEGMQAAAAIRDTAAAERMALDLAQQYNQVLSARIGLTGQMSSFYDQELAAQRATRDAAAEIAAAREAQVSGNGGDVKPFVAARQKNEIAGIDQDVVTLTDELKRAESELMDQITKRDNISASAAADEIYNKERTIKLTQDLAALEANLADSEKQKESYQPKSGFAIANADLLKVLGGPIGAPIGQAMTDGVKTDRDMMRSLRENAEILQPKIAAVKEELKQLKAQAEGPLLQNKPALDELTASINGLDQKVNKTYQEIAALKQLREQREALNKIERENIAFAAEKAKIEKAERAEPALQKAADTATAREKSLKEVTDEIGLLREANAIGGKKLALVQDEISLRQEAKQLAESTNLTESEALGILREKAQLLKDGEFIASQSSGTATTRREARTEQRAETSRAAKDAADAARFAARLERNERQNLSARERAEAASRERAAKAADRAEKRNPKDDGIQKKADLDQLAKEAAAARQKADAELKQNQKDQLGSIQNIEKAVATITAA